MKMTKKVSGNWAKKGDDVKDGDVVELLDGGQEDNSGEFGKRIVFEIKTRNGDKVIAFNQTSINTLIDEFGDESDSWVGNMVKVLVVKALVGGKMQNIYYFVPTNWEMLEDGSFVKVGGKNAATGQTGGNNDEISMDDIPV